MKPADLITAPATAFGVTRERWRSGSSCSERIRLLRSLLGPALTTRTVPAQPFAGVPETVELRYVARGYVIPAPSTSAPSLTARLGEEVTS